MSRFSVNIMSFDRPEYLGQVLASIRWNDLIDCDIHLWQDNITNKFSGNTYGKAERVEECVSIFKALFPDGMVHLNQYNLGIGIMYHQAEEYSFLERNYQAAIFIEDDFVPSPDYIRVVTALHEQTKDNPKIGSLSAYGLDRFTTFEEQAKNEFVLEPAVPSWGFMLNKKQWEMREAFYRPYFDLIKEVDYRLKDDQSILDWQKSLGFDINCTSQDASHSIANTMAGQVRLITRTRNAIYVGAHGLHFSPEQYNAGYYGKDPVWHYGDDLIFQIPSKEELNLELQKIKSKGSA